MNKLFKALMALDRLQVELADDSQYDTPSNEETRQRINVAMDLIDDVISNKKHIAIILENEDYDSASIFFISCESGKIIKKVYVNGFNNESGYDDFFDSFKEEYGIELSFLQRQEIGLKGLARLLAEKLEIEIINVLEF